jgi:hypothetical protein
MPEVDAFFAFSRLVTFHAPLYFGLGIEGALAGVKVGNVSHWTHIIFKLVDEILKLVDPTLYSHFISKEIRAIVYAMPGLALR